MQNVNGKKFCGNSPDDSVVPRHIFVPLKGYGHPKIEPKFFRTRFVKRSQARLEKAFLADLDALNFKDFTNRAHNHGEGSSVPLKYTVAIYTGVPKSTLVATLTLFRMENIPRGNLIGRNFTEGLHHGEMTRMNSRSTHQITVT